MCSTGEGVYASGQELLPVLHSFMRPSFRDFYFDDDTEFTVKVIDTWEMTVEERGTFKGKFRVELPGKSYMAVQIRKK